MSDAYDRLLLTLYGRVAEADWATEVLQGIVQATGSRSAAFVAVDVAQGRDSLPAFVGAEAAAALAYEQRYGAQNPWRPPAGIRSQAAGELLVSDDVLPLADLKRTAFWSDFLRPLGVAHGIGLIGVHEPDHVASLTLLRDEQRGRYTGPDLALLTRLAPHWAAACQLRKRLGLLTDAARGMADVVDGLATAVLLLDRHGQFVRANPSGDALLSSGGWLALRRGRPVARHGPGALLSRAIAAAAVGPSAGAAGTVVRVVDAGGRTVAHAVAHSVNGGSVRVALFVQPVEAKAGPGSLRRALRNAYGLTEREAQIACLLDGSRSLDEVAEAMGITPGSLRTRLKTVCGKLGVRGQMGLLLTIQSLRVALGVAP